MSLPRECPNCTQRFTGDRCAAEGELHANGRRYGRCPLSSDKGAERFRKGEERGKWTPCVSCSAVLVLGYNVCGPCALAATPGGSHVKCEQCRHGDDEHYRNGDDRGVRPCHHTKWIDNVNYRCQCQEFRPVTVLSVRDDGGNK